jgi:hypothetical protein
MCKFSKRHAKMISDAVLSPAEIMALATRPPRRVVKTDPAPEPPPEGKGDAEN